MKKLQTFRKIAQLIFLIILFTPFNNNLRQLGLFILVATLLIGPFYCGWMCPFGAVNDFTDIISKKLKIKKIKLPVSITKYSRYIRYVLFGLSLLGLNLTRQIDARHGLIDFVGGRTLTIILITVTVLFLLSSIFIERLFCNLVCTEGARYGVLGLMRLFSIKRDSSTCIDCKKCTKVCPMNIQVAEVKTHVRDAHCINCLECISTCPKEGALKFGRVQLSQLKKIDYFAILTAIIIFIKFLILISSNTGKH